MEKAFLIDSSDGGAEKVTVMLFSVDMDTTDKGGSNKLEREKSLHDSIVAKTKHALKMPIKTR